MFALQKLMLKNMPESPGALEASAAWTKPVAFQFDKSIKVTIANIAGIGISPEFQIEEIAELIFIPE